MEKIHSWKTDSRSAIQEISRLLRGTFSQDTVMSENLRDIPVS